jgi:hypothetical protein
VLKKKKKQQHQKQKIDNDNIVNSKGRRFKRVFYLKWLLGELLFNSQKVENALDKK